MLVVKGIVRAVVQVGFFSAVLLVPAGTWDWPRGIQFLAIYAVLMLISTVALAVYAPSSLEVRLQPAASVSQPVYDFYSDRCVSSSIAAEAFIFGQRPGVGRVRCRVRNYVRVAVSERVRSPSR